MLQIDDLPDETLIEILSRLPLKSAFATSVLSKRWQFLWPLVPNFKIDQDMFSRQPDTDFINFVDTAMDRRRGSPLVLFSLKCRCDSQMHAARINSWITSSIQCNVKKLRLNLDCSDPSFLTLDYIFGCQSLVECDLDVASVLKLPSSICLSNLKCLRLSYFCFTFLDDGLTEKKLDFPMLEELVIDSCIWRNYKPVHISAPKLQKVEIHNIEESIVAERKVWIFSDNIRSFSFMGVPSLEYRICGSTTQLSNAVLSVFYWEPDMSKMGVAANHCYKLVNGFSSVQDLTLSGDLLKLLESKPELIDTIPVFQSLTRLNLDDDNIWVLIDSPMLMKIYERCPLLEHLCIMREIDHESGGQELTPTPLCFQTHLRKIQIAVCPLPPGEVFDVDAVRILLNSASVLEEMILCFTDYGDDFADEVVSAMMKELGDEINGLPRASKDCKISVVRGDRQLLALG